MKYPCVYILASKKNGTLYVGITSDIEKRISQHKNKISCHFTSRYNCHTLVYYKQLDDMTNAIAREKQIKSGSRKKKIQLIEENNSESIDLFYQFF